MTILIFLLLKILFLNAEILNVQLEVNHQNYFDNNYRTFSRNFAHESIFGYNENKACIIYKNFRKWEIYTEQFTTLERTNVAFFNFITNQENLVPKICFEFNNHFYLFLKKLNSDEVIISRGQNYKILKNFKFDNLKYDHQSKRLFLIKENLIFEIELSYLEQLWLETENKINMIIKTNFITELYKNATDFIFFDNYIYLIIGGNIYKKALEKNAKLTLVRPTNSLIFNYLLYKPVDQVKLGKSQPIWIYFLYFINAILIFIIAFVLKKAKIIKRKTYHSSSNGFSEYFEDAPGHVVMQSLVGKTHNDVENEKAPY